MKQTLLFSGCLLAALPALAQDTTKKREVNVTASFRPTLKESTKLTFGATPPVADTSRPVLQYRIPNQNLVFAYQPGTLKPLALQVDSAVQWDNWNYVKAGYGTQRTPYFETGLSIGDPNKAALNIYGRYTSSKGKIKYQEYSQGGVDVHGVARAGSNHEVTGRLGYTDEQYNRYGYVPATLELPKDSVGIHYQGFRGRVGVRNISRTAYGISYAPELRVETFGNKQGSSETNSYIRLPLRKALENRFEVELTADGQFNSYTSADKVRSSNNWLQVSPSVFVKTAAIYLQAGIRPSWDNGAFKLMPNVVAEVSSPNKEVTLMAGWTGHLRANSFRSLAGYNPWIEAPDFVNNSRVQEIFGGLRGALTDHFSYLARVGFNTYTNQPLFINDGPTGRAFAVRYEPSMNALNIHGEIGYAVGERFSLRTVLDVQRYTGVDVNEKAWGLPTLEFNMALRLQVLRDLYVTGDLYAFDGVPYRTVDGEGKLKGAFDGSAGLEFKIVQNVKLWAQFNNVFNQSYERWKQYPVYGFNFLGGVVFSFPQTRK
ncbi:hypothetical protein [Flaviaesturariibacter amylovorans]|uniref:TonB-dependent receptor n=1 Tax=Flaviaesturariibacter amylovorans TaxID=1084520 RepID=A0ABP8GYC7_9BACT